MLEYNNVPLFTTFDYNKKYNVVKKENIVFIKLLFKDINHWSTILSEIMGKDIVIHNCNLTNEKTIFPLYTEFKKQYRIPVDYIENILNDREFKIYNTVADQFHYWNKWIKKSYTNIT